MKTSTWRRWHKWIGLFFCFFLLMFCLSGIVLNHRLFFADFSISRRYLPEAYRHQGWNQGLMRGTLRHGDSVLIYGTGGIWLADTTGTHVADLNAGLPEGDHRSIRSVVSLPDGRLYAAGMFNLFTLPHSQGLCHGRPCQWQKVKLPCEEERWSDLTLRGDTLVAVGRSHLYVARPPYREFERITLATPSDHTGKVSLFRTIWMLHSGEIFGLPGRLLMDAAAVVLILLSITGIAHWLFPKYLRRSTPKKRRHVARRMGQNIRLHDFLGRKTIVLTLLIAFTGWCLRPPLLIALIQFDTPPLPFSALDNANPWHDRLRMLRYDKQTDEWLLSASSGFYAFKDFSDTPRPLSDAPPVSVMGLNVFHPTPSGKWRIGSFSGFYEWNRADGKSYDYTTGATVKSSSASPFGKMAVSGFSRDFRSAEGDVLDCVVQHNVGTPLIAMPDSLRFRPMSLWSAAFELHNGRLFTFLGKPSLFYIFVSGLLTIIILWSGWKVRHRRRKRRNPKPLSGNAAPEIISDSTVSSEAHRE